MIWILDSFNVFFFFKTKFAKKDHTYTHIQIYKTSKLLFICFLWNFIKAKAILNKVLLYNKYIVKYFCHTFVSQCFSLFFFIIKLTKETFCTPRIDQTLLRLNTAHIFFHSASTTQQSFNGARKILSSNKKKTPNSSW